MQTNKHLLEDSYVLIFMFENFNLQDRTFMFCTQSKTFANFKHLYRKKKSLIKLCTH